MKGTARKALLSLLTAALIASMVAPVALAKENKNKKQPVAEEEQAKVKPSEPTAEESTKDNGNKPDEKAKKEEPKKSEPPGQEKESGKPAEKPKDNSPEPNPEEKPGPKPKENHKPEPSEEPVDTVTVPVSLHNGQGTTVKCPTRWHFVLVGVGKVFTPGTLTVTFSSGTQKVSAYKVNQQMAHYEVFTTGPTILTDASVIVTVEKRYQDKVKLNLSDYVESCPPPSDDDTKCPPPPPPPSDDDTKCPPPSDEETPPVPPKPPTPPKPPFKPVVRTVEVEQTVESKELPFTGGELYLLFSVALIAGAIGIFLKRDQLLHLWAQVRARPLLH